MSKPIKKYDDTILLLLNFTNSDAIMIDGIFSDEEMMCRKLNEFRNKLKIDGSGTIDYPEKEMSVEDWKCFAIYTGHVVFYSSEIFPKRILLEAPMDNAFLNVGLITKTLKTL